MGTIGANSDDSALGTISRSKSYPPLSAKIISTNQISPNSKFSISSVPPLRWSKNRKCAVNEPLAFPAFSETAFNLAFAEITGNTGHFIQHQVVRTLICGRPSPAGGPFGPRAISCAKGIYDAPRSREWGLGILGEHTRRACEPSSAAQSIIISASKAHIRRQVKQLTANHTKSPAHTHNSAIDSEQQLISQHISAGISSS